ncbi:MAG: V-type ATPase subunit, partial [Oscillospiraceae bacterium]|nr:V-type ATPase subunit [Oscillospiraceae bacterium]
MAKHIKDTDYLAISARIRAMEPQLVTKERMERVLEAHTDEEAAKLLQECGYPDLDLSTPETMDASLLAARQEMLSDLSGGVPDEGFLNIFKLKYDYHNLKALLKARLAGVSAAHILM